MGKMVCVGCGFVYDEEKGRAEENVPPGTNWENVPEDWCCPVSGDPKELFEPLENSVWLARGGVGSIHSEAPELSGETKKIMEDRAKEIKKQQSSS